MASRLTDSTNHTKGNFAYKLIEGRRTTEATFINQGSLNHIKEKFKHIIREQTLKSLDI